MARKGNPEKVSAIQNGWFTLGSQKVTHGPKFSGTHKKATKFDFYLHENGLFNFNIRIMFSNVKALTHTRLAQLAESVGPHKVCSCFT